MKSSAKRRSGFKNVNALIIGLGLPRSTRVRVARLSVSTQVIDRLVIERNKVGLTQAGLAKRMGCTQSRISKLEDSVDAELTLGEIDTYCAALGLEAGMSLVAS